MIPGELFSEATERLKGHIGRLCDTPYSLDTTVVLGWDMRFYPTGWVVGAHPIGPCARVGLAGQDDPWDFHDDDGAVLAAELTKHFVAGLCWILAGGSPKTARWETFHPAERGWAV